MLPPLGWICLFIIGIFAVAAMIGDHLRNKQDEDGHPDYDEHTDYDEEER